MNFLYLYLGRRNDRTFTSIQRFIVSMVVYKYLFENKTVRNFNTFINVFIDNTNDSQLINIV